MFYGGKGKVSPLAYRNKRQSRQGWVNILWPGIVEYPNW